jgi:predicted esterase
MDVHVVPTMTHGRVLVQEARAAARRGLLVGFHGYMESAKIQMDRLQAIPDASLWTLVSIQGLHRFYRGRSEDVVASWMTREDRELAIADNLAYVAAALEQVPHDPSTRVVYTGFSQGVAMAFRAGLRGTLPAAAIVAVGGDVPPELVEDPSLRFPAVLFARGSRDEWLTEPRFEKDVAALRSRAAGVEPLVYDGAHEWNLVVSDAIGAFLSRISRGH